MPTKQYAYNQKSNESLPTYFFVSPGLRDVPSNIYGHLRDTKRARVRSEGNVASCGGSTQPFVDPRHERLKLAHAPMPYSSRAYSTCIEQGLRKVNEEKER